MKTTIMKKKSKRFLGYLMATAIMTFSYSAFAQTNHSVIIDSGNNSFTPALLTINVGDTITWKNDDGFHNVNGNLATFPGNPDGSVYSGGVSDSWSVYEWVCTTAGNYDYQCDPQAAMGMVGTIIANGPTTTSVNNIISDPISEYLYSINILGKKTNRLVKNQIIFDVYRNGDVVNRFAR